MLKLSGTLTIKTIHGRQGPFNVGRLLAEEGEFAVKEPLLDQYEEAGSLCDRLAALAEDG